MMSYSSLYDTLKIPLYISVHSLNYMKLDFP